MGHHSAEIEKSTCATDCLNRGNEEKGNETFVEKRDSESGLM